MAGGTGIVMLKEGANHYTLEWLLSERYTNIEYDSISDKYWFYNRENITLVNPANNKTITFSKALFDLLTIHSFSNIKLDKYGNVYMLTDNKIVVFSMSKLQISFLPVNVDLSSAFFEIYNNKLLIAGKFGVGYATIINPFKISDFKYTANIRNFYYNRIQDMVVGKNGVIMLNTDKAFYTIPIGELEDNSLLFSASDKYFMDLVVNFPEQKVITRNDTFYLPGTTPKISFDLINFYGSGNRSYSYKIDNHNWQESVSGDVFLPELEPGVYHHIKCVANDDVWKSKTYDFVIYINPLWWQTPIWRIAFWTIGVVLFIVLLATVIILTRHYSAKANEKKQANTELELRALYAQINPHFIFNTLSSAMFFISKNRFDEAYQHISKFSRLLRSYLKSSQERYVRLSEEIDMLENYIELQQTRFENKFDYSIEIENKIPKENVQIPSLLLQPLLENAINHGLFHKEGKGFLKLQFYQGASNNELICIIEDNGIGREKAREIRKHSMAQYDSYGTKLTKQLIDIFKQYERMNIYLEYIDKEEPETGTIVKLIIKNIKYVA
jgi:two-component sensor histidine kinase